MPPNTSKPVTSILDAIGNTPVVRLHRVVAPDSADVFVKLESMNPTGSYKDRMAKAMVEGAEHRGELRPDATVVEATGGSTGSALSMVCAVKGYKFLAFTSDAYADEKLLTMKAFGATLDVTRSPGRNTTPDLMASMKERAAQVGNEPDSFYTDQFSNKDALLGYADIGRELVEQFPGGIDVFCGAYGTAGMMMGVSGVLRAQMPTTKIVMLEPDTTALLSKGADGAQAHGIDGVAPGFISEHVRKDLYDEVRTIEEQEARDMCRRLAREEGLLVGTSSGMNIVAALRIAKELGPGKKVVTVACDTGLKYLNGPLFSQD